MEDPSCFREMQDSNKRADIVVENWRGRGRAILDVSVTHPWTQSSMRESEKIRKYEAVVHADSVFVPLVVETFGRWGPRAREIFDECVEKLCASKAAPK